MHISDFEGLVMVARSQPLPQRMLFVFVKTVIGEDASAEERAGFEAGEGGALRPCFYVDIGPGEVGSFEALVAEADERSTEWDKVLVACMDAPRGSQMSVDMALKSLVGRVQSGAALTGLLCFSREGTPVMFG
jgi:hypothetical protein